MSSIAHDLAAPVSSLAHEAMQPHRVDDVDIEYQKLRGWITTFANEPTTMPWGNRSLLFRDPDGNLVNLFTPVTAEAIEKFSSYAR